MILVNSGFIKCIMLTSPISDEIKQLTHVTGLPNNLMPSLFPPSGFHDRPLRPRGWHLRRRQVLRQRLRQRPRLRQRLRRLRQCKWHYFTNTLLIPHSEMSKTIFSEFGKKEHILWKKYFDRKIKTVLPYVGALSYVLFTEI